MIEMPCPHCGYHLRIKEKYAGREGRCEKCNGPIRVPEAGGSSHPSEPRLGMKAPPPPPGGGSTALENLQVNDNWEPPPAVAGVDTAASPQHSRVGCLYWLLVVFFTPGALIWGIVLPKDHPQKAAAIIIPIFIMVLVPVIALLIVGAGYFATKQLASEDGGGIVSDSGALAITPAQLQVEVSPSAYSTLEANNPRGQENALTWRSSDPEIAKVVGNPQSAMVYGMSPGTATITAEGIMSGEQATATVTVVAATAEETTAAASTNVADLGTTASAEYAATGLPPYPGMEFDAAPHKENAMYPSLGVTDASVVSTFKGLTSGDYEAISTHFYEHLTANGWTITTTGYGNPDNGEFFMYAQRGGERVGYATKAENGQVAVYLSLADASEDTLASTPPPAVAPTATSTSPAVAPGTSNVPIGAFPRYGDVQFTPSDTPPGSTGIGNENPDYIAIFEGTVARGFKEVSDFYKERLRQGQWYWISFRHMDAQDQYFSASGDAGDDLQFVLQGKPTGDGGTRLRLGFYE